MDVRKFRGAGVLMLCLLLTAAGIWNFRQGSLEVAGGISAGPVNEVDTAEAKVGLIFQVTGNGEETENVLKILRENGKKATFFVTESWGESWPELVTKIIQEGHELGLLSQEGKRWDRLSGREARSLLEQNGFGISQGENLRSFRSGKNAMGQDFCRRFRGQVSSRWAGLWTQKIGRITGATPFLRP